METIGTSSTIVFRDAYTRFGARQWARDTKAAGKTRSADHRFFRQGTLKIHTGAAIARSSKTIGEPREAVPAAEFVR